MGPGFSIIPSLSVARAAHRAAGADRLEISPCTRPFLCALFCTPGCPAAALIALLDYSQVWVGELRFVGDRLLQ